MMGYVVIEQFTDKVLNKERRKILGRFDSEVYAIVFRDALKDFKNKRELFVVSEYDLYHVEQKGRGKDESGSQVL